MKLFTSIGCLLFAASISLPAATITGLYNTGVDNTGAPLSTTNGVTDPHYTVMSSPDNTGTPHAAVTYFPYYCPGCYLADGPNSNWISVNTNGSDGNSGYYDYQTTFTIGSGYDPSTAIITGQFLADNDITATEINGSTVSGATTATSSDPRTDYTSFTINSGFISGLNTLDFIVLDDSSPSALRVDSLSGTVSPLNASAVPEPASLFLMLGGVMLLGFRKLAKRA